MSMKLVAGLAFLLNALLFATYYAVSKEALGRIDPIVFSFFEMMSLAPAGLCILAVTWSKLSKGLLKRGILLGSSLCLALFTISIALKHTTATSTAFFPSLNGFLAAFVAGIFLRQPISKNTWLAGTISVIGTVMLVMNTQIGGVRGSLIAFLGGIFFTSYVFLSDYLHKEEDSPLALFGVELLTMAAWASLIALLFGDWNAFHPEVPKDILVVLYISTFCTFVPTLLAVFMQRYISPVTVSFLYILEPVLGALIAFLYLRETLPLNGYAGGALVVVGAIIHTWGTVERPGSEPVLAPQVAHLGQRMVASALGSLAASISALSVGAWLLYKISGFPTPLWSELYQFGLLLPLFQHQGQGMVAFLVIARALCWLVAWAVLIVMICLTFYRTVNKLLNMPKEEEEFVLDARTLRHMSTTSYLAHTLPKKEDTPLVRRRRRDRRERLTRIELVE